MAALWSDYTDGVITNIDDSLKGKYKFTVREFLTNPAKFAKQPNIETTAGNMQDDALKFVDTALAGMTAQKAKLDSDVSKADSATKQLSQSISMQAKQYKIPVVRPALTYRDQTKDEIIYVDTVDTSITALVEKLVSSSKYITDSTVRYGNSSVGEWYFSGDKQYVLRVYLPPNEALSLQGTRDELALLFDTAKDFIKAR
ncbi:MAG: hypothetical protein LVQ95_00075 [Candidatus Micrarchaeales archaeon]|nr:hypothetical protein [Candidatus Micrarchaeales archaeon]